LFITLSLLSIFIFSSHYPLEAKTSVLSPLFSFQSYIDIEYNTSIFQNELSLNKSYNIPLTIIYTSDLPIEFVDRLKPLNGALFMQSNWIIFGKSMLQQIINVSILNKEAYHWVQMNLTNTKIYAEGIPFKDEEIRVQTSLIFSPLEQAPAQFDHIMLRIECEDLGILKGVTYDALIEYKPVYRPMITIAPRDSLQLVKPNDAVNYNIIIENHSNKMIRLTSTILTNESTWNPTINPTYCDIEPDTDTFFIFSVISPATFGWHDAIEEFDILFSTELFPIQENRSIDETYHIQLKAKNYGFSTPSFEFIGFALAALCMISLSKIYTKKRGGR
jgi:hypothetical protein